MKPEPVQVEVRTETRTAKFVVISGKWLFPVEQKVVIEVVKK